MQVESRFICKSPKTPESKLADYVEYIEEGQLCGEGVGPRTTLATNTTRDKKPLQALTSLIDSLSRMATTTVQLRLSHVL